MADVLAQFIAQFSDLIGVVGVSFVVGSYIWLHFNNDAARTVAYPAYNALGAGLIIVSLMYDWNLSAFLVEVIWGSVSLFGVARALRARMRMRAEAASVANI